VLNMVAFFEPAAICDMRDIVLAPLPSKTSVWRAPDAQAWFAESKKRPGIETAYGLASNGDLVRFDDNQPACNNAVELQSALHTGTAMRYSTCGWDEWCAGMDSFGGLVMLAASLIA
jgi:hypothetical protein